jgi:sialic acid synthase SpsE
MKRRTSFPAGPGFFEIGEGLPTYLIAEIGLNHNGSEELARELIYEASVAGASFVKLQKRDPGSLATAAFLDAPFEKCPLLGSTQRQVRERLELTLDEYRRLAAYAEGLGLVFFASAFDLPSLEFLVEAGVSIIKIASHSITNGPLLERVADQNLAVVASLGGATEEEQDRAVNILSSNPLVLLHCVSAYPTPDGATCLDTIGHLERRYGVPVGFSSHEVGIDVSVAASVLGACMVERHFTLSRSMVGLDHTISLEPDEFAEMARRISRIHTCRGISTGLDDREAGARNNYHVSICAATNIAAGTILEPSMLTCKQPLRDSDSYFTGLEMDSVVGKKAASDLDADSAVPRSAVIG